MTDSLPNENELLTVAFSLHSNPGAYALLLGAGVSAPSGIPTAWGVLEDLVARTADLAGAAPADAIAWYEEQFGEYPTYEGVLERIAPTQIERQRLLRGYFEQSPEDVEAGRKIPTPAHRAIAKLVQSGSVRIILTLNFDHLIEQALRAEGIEPTIVASPADVEGMAPLHTLDCCVIHLHGDYLNPTTMLNTVTELKAYHPSTSRLLQRILEDYGLIVAGWSSKYDPALRDAIATHYPNRFTLTWFEPARPSEEATILRTLKRGVHITQDADIGFGSLADGVTALTNRRARHPLTIPVTIETAKRELSGRTVAIGLHDRLRKELDALHRLPEFHLTDHNNGGDYETMLARIEEATRLPAALLAALTYWGDSDTDSWWIDELPRFATPVDGSGLVKLLSLRVVSGSILFYAAGVAAVARGRFDLLGRIFALRRPHRHNGELETFASSVDAEAGYEGARNPRTRLFDVVSPLLADSLSLGTEPLEDAWQMFEVLRLTWATRHSSHFDALQAEYAEKDKIFQATNSAFDEAQRRPGADTSAAQTARTAAWQDRDRVLGRICRLAPVGRPHILTADNRGDDRYQSVTAMRLAHDLSAERVVHSAIASGLLEDVDSALLAVKAVSTRLGMIGYELAWERVRDAAGIVPMQLWIDSGQTPQERTRDNGTRLARADQQVWNRRSWALSL
jgi:hypothetical protein